MDRGGRGVSQMQTAAERLTGGCGGVSKITKNVRTSSNSWQGEKDGKTEIQKFEYLENEKGFLDEIKNIFQSLKSYHLVRNKDFYKK